MKEKEFKTLSGKRKTNLNKKFQYNFYLEEDVKEFIKLLKEKQKRAICKIWRDENCLLSSAYEEILCEINKLAGPKLTK